MACVLLLALALRTDSDEVEQDEQSDEENDLEQFGAGRWARRRRCLGMRSSDEHGRQISANVDERGALARRRLRGRQCNGFAGGRQTATGFT
jgi:hypothetical protein